MKQNEIRINRDEIYKIPEYFIGHAQRFKHSILIFECALKEIQTKFDVLNMEMSHRTKRNPISSVKARIKKPESIIQKMMKEDVPLTIESLNQNVHDVAGVRVICSYIDDIYDVYNMLISQDDITVVQVKDYIKNPKDNGYRSLHVIVEIPVFLSEGKEHAKVEIQFRTIAMDFWASLEHEIRYKKDFEDLERVANDLYECAETIAETDERMMNIRKEISKAYPDLD